MFLTSILKYSFLVKYVIQEIMQLSGALRRLSTVTMSYIQ